MLYLFLIIKSCSWLWYYDVLFGTNAIAFEGSGFINPYVKPGFLLSVFHWEGLPLLFILLTASSSVFLLLFSKIALRLAAPLNVLIWLLVLNLQNKIYPTLTGGNFLLNQFLFFNYFLSGSFAANDSKKNDLKVCLHNFAVLAIIIQVCLTYFLSALAKLNDAEWRSGNALEMILSVDHYFVFHNGKPPLSGMLSLVVNYLVMLYQLAFPVLIFVSRLKKPLVVVGILMHLYIAFVMGLVDFGLIMMMGYVYFWPFKSQHS